MLQDNSKKILIIGQGISGTMLSWYLHKAGIDFLVIDQWMPNTPSRIASGIINPVTGRRVVKVWLDDIIIPFAENTYTEMGLFLQQNLLHKTSIIEFFPNPFMKEAFMKKLSEKMDYIRLVHDDISFKNTFNYEFGTAAIEPAYIVQLSRMLDSWRNFLKINNKLIEEEFEAEQLGMTDQYCTYKNISASHIVFCDGARGADNPYFRLLPFALNKGEALVINAELDPGHVYKKSLTLVPLSGNKFWAGTNYVWDFDDETPSQNYFNSTLQHLTQWLKVPFTVTGHNAAIRPATVERRPFVGFHPIYKNIGILNGMGTKGCSLAPFFAFQLFENIIYNKPIMPEADIARFNKILSK